MNYCPVPDCHKQIPTNHAFCGRHWAAVPVEQKSKINRLFHRAPLSQEHRNAVALAAYGLSKGIKP